MVTLNIGNADTTLTRFSRVGSEKSAGSAVDDVRRVWADASCYRMKDITTSKAIRRMMIHSSTSMRLVVC